MKIVLRRIAALVADIAAALFVAFAALLFAQAAEFVDGASRFTLPATLGVFVVLRTMGLSMGSTTFGLRVDGSSVAKNFIRVTALLVPGYNVFDWMYIIRNPLHQTFTDMKLGVRVVDDTLR